MYVDITGMPTGRATCAAATSYWMIPNENSETGKKLYAALLAAQLAGRSVQVMGKGTCTRWGDGEDINWVEVL